MISTFKDQSIVAQVLATNRAKKMAAHADERKKLSPDFQPGPRDVICARGKAAAGHSGNVLFRKMIKAKLCAYSAAKSRIEKSVIVSAILDSVREGSPNGGFVKQDNHNMWYEVGENAAREKVGQGFRDLLHTKYRSSYQAKQRLKKGAAPVTSDSINKRIEPTQIAMPKTAVMPLTSEMTRKAETQKCGSYNAETQTFIGSFFSSSSQNEDFEDLLRPLSSPCNLESMLQDYTHLQTLKQLATMRTDFKPIFSKTPAARCLRSHAA